MQWRHISFEETEQVFGLYEYLTMRCEVFLDFDPVPYPEGEDEPSEARTRALNTTPSGG